MTKKIYSIFHYLLFFSLLSCSEVKRKDTQELIQKKQVEEYYHDGITNFANQKYYIAIKCFNNALEIDSTYNKAIIGRGCTKAKLKDFLGAIEDFNDAISKNPYDTIAYYNRGVTFSKLKKYSNALNDFNLAIELNKKYADAYKGRGITKLLMHQKNGCLDLSKAGELGSVEAYTLIKEFCN